MSDYHSITAFRTVVVAEKPSVAADIARVLACRTKGTGCYISSDNKTAVTWAVGHLVGLCEPDEIDERYKKWRMDTLPILPESIPLKILPSSASQYKTVSGLINSPETRDIVCATDAGREGELIFRYIYQKSGCSKPVRRLWINSMTDEAIREGLKAMKPDSDYDGLYESAHCRSVADWLVGMNASRAFSLRYDAHLTVGRVQTPTLAILVRRRKEIEAFQSELYYTVTADFGDYQGVWFSGEGERANRIAQKQQAEAIANAVRNKPATVVSAETVKKTEPAPQLFDLTSLQREANKLLGFTAAKTLSVAQSLYEKRKALTYPRTDSKYLPPDMIGTAARTIQMLPAEYQPYVHLAMPDGKIKVTPRVFDASKVTDHHALIPTAKRADPATFDPDERALYDLVARRLLAAFSPQYIYNATQVITACEGHTFKSNGQVVLNEGFKAIAPTDKPPKKSKSKDPNKDSEAPKTLPPLSPGDTRTVLGADLKEEKTQPPKPHTDASLLAAMEHADRELDDESLKQSLRGSGLGTPATRAAIIDKLIATGYAARKGKTLNATDKGVQLISVMPGEIASPEMTGRWELELERIAHAHQSPEPFMQSIRRYTAWLTEYAKTKADPNASFDSSRPGRPGSKTYKNKSQGPKAAVLPGERCPLCGGDILETQKAFGCSKWQTGCPFTLWKDGLRRQADPAPLLNARIMHLLLADHRVAGSTGVLELDDQELRFSAAGDPQPSARMPIRRGESAQTAKRRTRKAALSNSAPGRARTRKKPSSTEILSGTVLPDIHSRPKEEEDHDAGV